MKKSSVAGVETGVHGAKGCHQGKPRTHLGLKALTVEAHLRQERSLEQTRFKRKKLHSQNSGFL